MDEFKANEPLLREMLDSVQPVGGAASAPAPLPATHAGCLVSVTRLAPSPTGALHLGNARTFLANWLLARQHGWKISCASRISTGHASSAAPTSRRLTTCAGSASTGMRARSIRAAGLTNTPAPSMRLSTSGQAYACVCTRRESISPQARHMPKMALRFIREPAADSFASIQAARDAVGREPAVRFNVDHEFVDSKTISRASTIRDGTARRFRDSEIRSTPAYQLAVVVDDAAMNVTHVVRGDDLLDSTPRQIMLYRALGWAIECPPICTCRSSSDPTVDGWRNVTVIHVWRSIASTAPRRPTCCA